MHFSVLMKNFRIFSYTLQPLNNTMVASIDLCFIQKPCYKKLCYKEVGVYCAFNLVRTQQGIHLRMSKRMRKVTNILFKRVLPIL